MIGIRFHDSTKDGKAINSAPGKNLNWSDKIGKLKEDVKELVSNK